MKGKFDFKRLLILLAIIIIIVVAFVLCFNLFSEKEASEDEQQIAEEYIRVYVSTLTKGYNTIFGGTDLLYKNDYTLDDLSNGMILNSAIKYATENNMSTEVSSFVIQALEEANTYSDISSYNAYNADTINEAIKLLFGMDVTGLESVDELGYGYNIHYNETYNIYVMGANSSYTKKDSDKAVEYYIVKTTTKGDSLKTELAIGYTMTDGDDKYYYSDANFENEISITDASNTFPTDEVDSFDKYIVTFTKNSDGNYIFESIMKEEA